MRAADPALGPQTPKEVRQPVSDPLIWACLLAAQELQQDQPSSSWLHATMDYIVASGYSCTVSDHPGHVLVAENAHDLHSVIGHES